MTNTDFETSPSQDPAEDDSFFEAVSALRVMGVTTSNYDQLWFQLAVQEFRQAHNDAKNFRDPPSGSVR